MAIGTYGTLKAGIASWMERSDLTALLPDFIGMAEAQMWNGERGEERGWLRAPLRIRAMIATGSLTPADGAADLSTLTRYLEAERVYWNGATGRLLQYLPPRNFWGRRGAYEGGTPEFYTTEGYTLRIGPYDTTALSIAYYQRFASLSADADTNWILTNHPEVYLRGALWQGYLWEGADAKADREHALFNAQVNALQQSEEWASASGATLQMAPSAVV